MDHDRADRRVAAAQPLAARDQVWHHTKVIHREVGSGSSEAGDHLVRYQEDVVSVTDLADAPEILLGRHDGAVSSSPDGLADEGGDGIRTVAVDGHLQIIGAGELTRGVLELPWKAIAVRRSYVREIEKIGLEVAATLAMSAGRHGSKSGPVVA